MNKSDVMYIFDYFASIKYICKDIDTSWLVTNNIKIILGIFSLEIISYRIHVTTIPYEKLISINFYNNTIRINYEHINLGDLPINDFCISIK